MWAIENRTPYKAESTWGRDKDGVHEWIVAVKATYDIKPDGSTKLADEQLDPLLMAEYNGEPGFSSLRYDADLVAPKPTTDIIINGTAYAPKGQPSTDFLVSAQVGKIRKTIRVIGNRKWKRTILGSKPSRPEPIRQLPIVYEHAFGGYDQMDPNPQKQFLDTRNPIGCGAVADPFHRVDKPVPNFEYPNGNMEKDGPAGFGALDSFWSPRRELGGTYDKAWKENRCPLLPEDWDPHSLLCSPPDQRPEKHLRGGEPVELINLTPNGLLRFRLPKIYLTFRSYFGERKEEHRSHLSTVVIEPDHPRVIMVWISALTCRTDVDYLDETVVDEKEYI